MLKCSSTTFEYTSAWMAADYFQYSDVNLFGAGPLVNGDFETGNISPWIQIVDTSWEVKTNSADPGKHVASTCDAFQADWGCDDSGSEDDTGTLRSKTFTVTTDSIAFKIGGHMGNNPCNNQKNYVRLYIDGTSTFTTYVPCQDAFADRGWKIDSADVGKDGYIELVDTDAGTGYAWISADEFRFIGSAKLAVQEVPLPLEFRLVQNRPNPFNPETVIDYDVPKEGEVKLAIYNMLGQPVRVLVDDMQSAGRYSITWDGRNQQGTQVASGVYVYKLISTDYEETRKLTLVR